MLVGVTKEGFGCTFGTPSTVDPFKDGTHNRSRRLIPLHWKACRRHETIDSGRTSTLGLVQLPLLDTFDRLSTRGRRRGEKVLIFAAGSSRGVLVDDHSIHIASDDQMTCKLAESPALPAYKGQICESEESDHSDSTEA